MPELPEVETIRSQLSKVLPGLVIREVEVRVAKMFVGDVRDVKGGRIEKVERAGKMIIIKLKCQTCLPAREDYNAKLKTSKTIKQ